MKPVSKTTFNPEFWSPSSGGICNPTLTYYKDL
jgi:hypothetical protein